MIRTLYDNAVKRNIQFDDSDCSLVFNVRLSADDLWVSVSVSKPGRPRKC